jgi:ABC-type nitrate/sulfonate/bicarbonate transport system permease component
VEQSSRVPANRDLQGVSSLVIGEDEDKTSPSPTTNRSLGTGPRPRRRPQAQGWRRFLGPASIVGGLALWQVLADTGIVNQSLSSSPSDVWSAGWQSIQDGTLGSAVGSSAQLYGTGLLISILLGVGAGIILGWWRTLGAIFDPWIAILYSTPLIAILPLIIVWFGIGFQGQVVLVVLVAVFPLLVNVITGTRQVDESLLRLARSYGASQFAVVRSLVLPSLVPYAVTGLRLSVGMSLIGVVIAEYFEGSNGVGGLILKAGTELNASLVFVGIVVLAGTAITLTTLIRIVERKVSSWREP